MARDTSNDPVVNLPLDYKFDGNGNIIQKVFFGVNAVFCPVWYWWYFKSNRDPNFWVGDSDMDGYDPEECATEFLHRMDNFTPEESCNLFEVAKYCDRMTGVTVFDVVNGRNVNERHLDDYYTGYDLGIEDDDEDEEDDTDIEMEFEGQPVSPQPMRVCDEGPCQFMLPPVLNCGTDDGSGYEVEIPLRAKTTKSGTPQERLSFYIPADIAVQWFREVTGEPQADYQLFQTVWMDRANRLENPHFVDHLFSYAFWQERLLRILHYTYKRGKVQSARIVADYEGDAAEFIGKYYPEAEVIGHQGNENAFETGAAYLVDLTLDYKYKGDKLVEKKTFSVLGSFGREWYRLFSGNPNATVDDFYAWCEQTDTYEPLRQAAETAGAIVQYTTYGLRDGKLTSKRTEDHQGRTNVEINEAAELRDRMLTQTATGPVHVIRSSLYSQEVPTLISPICWFAAFLVALVALCYSIHLERHNYQHKLFGFEINSNRRIVAFGILALGAFCLFAPVTWAQCFSSDLGEGWEPGAFNFISWVITNFFAVGWTTTIQTGLTDVTSTVYSAIPLGGSIAGQVFNLLYSLLTLAYIIALPVEIGLFAFNAVATRLSGSVIKRHLKYADHAIIFESVDANTELLARDIVNNIKDGTLNNANGNGDIALIFCLGSDEDSERQRVLRNLCQGYVRYVFTDTEAADVLTTITSLRDAVKHLLAVDVVATSEETEHNVSATIDMLEATHRDPQAGCTPKITLHCTHKNPDDAQIFDAIKADNEPTCLHLLSRVQDEIYDVLEEAPLYSVLEPIDISVNPNPKPQNLTVLVFGAGNFGMQATRTSFWMGRMPGVRLNIVVVDPNARTILEREAARYPEMFGESCNGIPTIRFVEAEAPSVTTDRLIAGGTVTTLHYDAQSKCVSSKADSALITDDARLYAFVTMGDCGQNLSYSLMLQRQIFNRFIDQGSPDYTKQQPVICPHIESEEILGALKSLDKTQTTGKDAANIMHPFGARKAFYTYGNIINDERERLAVQLNAAYDLCFNGSIKNDFDATLAVDKAVNSYNGKESNKSSSRASAAHIPYRFWALGFSHADVEQGSFEHAWREKLQGKVKPASNNDNIANAILSSVVPDAATKAEFDASEQKNREEFALICRLGDMEHDRWLAYCQATGMTELGHGTVEQEREQRMRAAVVDAFLSGKPNKSGAEGVRKSDTLMRHAYMTPDNDVLGARGFLLGKDVYAYDRIIVALSARIAKGNVVKPKKDMDK